MSVCHMAHQPMSVCYMAHLCHMACTHWLGCIAPGEHVGELVREDPEFPTPTPVPHATRRRVPESDSAADTRRPTSAPTEQQSDVPRSSTSMSRDWRWEISASFSSAPKPSAPAMILRGRVSADAAAAVVSAMVDYSLESRELRSCENDERLVSTIKIFFLFIKQKILLINQWILIIFNFKINYLD